MQTANLPTDLQATLQASERYKQRMRVQDPERYEKEYGHEAHITNKLSLTDLIRTDFMRIGTASHDPQKAREMQIDRLYNSLKTGARKPTTMTETQFMHFAPIYDIDYRTKVQNGTLTAEESELLGNLSEELFRTIDVTEPLTVVADDDPSKVLEAFPPIFMRLNIKPSVLNEAMQDYSSATALDDGVAGGVAGNQIKRAMRNVVMTMSRNQDWNDLTRQFSRAQQLRLQFNKHRGIDQNHPLAKQAAHTDQKIAEAKAATNSDNADDLDFEPVES